MKFLDIPDVNEWKTTNCMTLRVEVTTKSAVLDAKKLDGEHFRKDMFMAQCEIVNKKVVGCEVYYLTSYDGLVLVTQPETAEKVELMKIAQKYVN